MGPMATRTAPKRRRKIFSRGGCFSPGPSGGIIAGYHTQAAQHSGIFCLHATSGGRGSLCFAGIHETSGNAPPSRSRYRFCGRGSLSSWPVKSAAELDAQAPLRRATQAFSTFTPLVRLSRTISLTVLFWSMASNRRLWTRSCGTRICSGTRAPANSIAVDSDRRRRRAPPPPSLSSGADVGSGVGGAYGPGLNVLSQWSRGEYAGSVLPVMTAALMYS